jgi:TrmH family RNA methyltransferase
VVLPLGALHDRIEVVLVSPRNPLNIGAVARAMANFGLTRLSVVAPFEPHWREARSAVGAQDLLEHAKSMESLAEALAGCTLVVGTGTLTRRSPGQTQIPLPELAPEIGRAIDDGGRVAVVFGPEKRGLTRADLSRCHLVTEIPTDPRQPSMNLGQAVAVCLYELSVRLSRSAQASSGPDIRQGDATSGELDHLAEVIDSVMMRANYSPENMREANRQDLRLLLRRLAITRQDVGRMLGFFRRVLRRLDS